MTESEIFDGLTAILRQVFDDPEIVATPDLSARDVAEWDSFNHINIVVAAEMRFGVSFKSSELEELKNVGDFAALIRAKTRH